MTRFRKLISTISAMTVLFTTFTFIAPQKVAATDEYDMLRLKWKEMLTGGTGFNPQDPDIAISISTLDETAREWWDSMVKTGGNDREFLWSDLSNPESSHHITASYNRIRDIATAYNTIGTGLYNDPDVRDGIIGALEWMNVNRYNASGTMYANWWDWQIGSPLALNDCVVLMYDHLTQTQINNYMDAIYHFIPSPASAGANLVWTSTVTALRGVIIKSGAKIAEARDALSPIFNYVTSGDGFYEDGSFIQHYYYSYTGGYGDDLLKELGSIMYLLEGSTWEITDPDKYNVFKWVYDAYDPLIYRGAMMDMTRGRCISRFLNQDHVIGHKVIRAIIRLSQFAPAADAAAFKSMIKEWIQSDYQDGAYHFFKDATVSAAVLAKAILNDPSIPARGELIRNKQYNNMARTVHHRPGFAFGISMFSNRNYNYESINGENLKGWHTSSGMTYLYNSDLNQFSDNFWPTVNSYRLPGTTVLQNTEVPPQKPSDQSWVGGSELLGLYGATGMSLHQYGTTGFTSLRAHKSWFMFDDEIVALGAGINSSEGIPVETIVENRKINAAGDNTLLINGTAKSTVLGWSETMTGVNWAHLSGNVPGSDIGYYFPGTATLKGLREARTDSWSAINAGAVDYNYVNYTRNYLTLWFDHGTAPVNATYSYVLLPGKTPVEVSGYASNPGITILENSASAQGVRENTLNVTGVNFWQDAVKKVGIIQADRKSSVMIKENEDSIDVAVCDPTYAASGTLNIEIHRSGADILSADPAITVVSLSPVIKFKVDLAGLKGRSVTAKFALPDCFIEAENYSSASSNINLENCYDIAGGLNIGGAYNNDWVRYDNVDFGTGVEKIDLRAATARTSGSTIELRLDSITGTLIGTAQIPYTGGWQSWTNVPVYVTGASGVHDLYLVFKRSDSLGVANVNWIQYSKPVVKRIEAEDFCYATSNIKKEICYDTGGGYNVGGAYNGDYAAYNTAYFASGIESINMRLASVRSGGTIELRLDSPTGMLIGTAAVPNTGGWQNWQTVNVPVAGATSAHKLYLVFKRPDGLGVGNVNWIEYIKK